MSQPPAPSSSAKPSAKTVVLVGHCGPDSSFLKMAVRSASPGATVGMADSDAELDAALGASASGDARPDLLLFNRVMEPGFSAESGVEVMRSVRAKNPDVKMMLVSNYADAQQSAVDAGALPGFGKNDIGQEKAKTALREALGT